MRVLITKNRTTKYFSYSFIQIRKSEKILLMKQNGEKGNLLLIGMEQLIRKILLQKVW